MFSSIDKEKQLMNDELKIKPLQKMIVVNDMPFHDEFIFFCIPIAHGINWFQKYYDNTTLMICLKYYPNKLCV